MVVRNILLSKGGAALVDEADWADVSQFDWNSNGAGYAQRNTVLDGRRTTVFMHREIMGLKRGDGLLVDHANGNRLDNRRENLRICTRSQNQWNRGAQSNSKSGVKGVFWDARRQKWRASIKQHRKEKHIGYFDSIVDAANAYAIAAAQMHGDFAKSSTAEAREQEYESAF